jgi:glucoamylase
MRARVPALALLVLVAAEVLGPATASVPVRRIPLYADAPRHPIGELAWLADGTVPGIDGPYEDMARTALLDLHALTLPGGAAVAGWAPHWRYVWPRDASFVAVAYARTGHVADARRILDFLQRVQAPDGSFQARYRPDGTLPDARGIQEDGPGWALWALSEVAPADARYRRLLDRSAARLLARSHAGLPPPSSDYWERPETVLTLGIAAPTLAGLDAAAYAYGQQGEHERAAHLTAVADATADRILDIFGADYPRHAGRRDAVADTDASITFLARPYQRRGDKAAMDRAAGAISALERPNGGLAPGAAWHDDGVSWTPETALFALTFASDGGHLDMAARRYLDWLDAHRTRTGSIPEKVLADGTPASVAPLAWSAAIVVLAVDALDRY